MSNALPPEDDAVGKRLPAAKRHRPAKRSNKWASRSRRLPDRRPTGRPGRRDANGKCRAADVRRAPDARFRTRCEAIRARRTGTKSPAGRPHWSKERMCGSAAYPTDARRAARRMLQKAVSSGNRQSFGSRRPFRFRQANVSVLSLIDVSSIHVALPIVYRFGGACNTSTQRQ